MNDSDSVFDLAVKNGHIDIVKFLFNRGAILTDSTFKYSVENEQLNILKYLVQTCGADIHTNCDYALRYSAIIGDIEKVKYLVENGADIHANNNEAFLTAIIK